MNQLPKGRSHEYLSVPEIRTRKTWSVFLEGSRKFAVLLGLCLVNRSLMRNQNPHVHHAQLWGMIQSSTAVLWTLKQKGNFKTGLEPVKTVETNRDRFNTLQGHFQSTETPTVLLKMSMQSNIKKSDEGINCQGRIQQVKQTLTDEVNITSRYRGNKTI